jgi:hypothetical protein
VDQVNVVDQKRVQETSSESHRISQISSPFSRR